MSLTARLTIAMVLLALSTAAVVGMLTYRNLGKAILPSELARLQAHAQRQGAGLDEVISLARDDAVAFATGAAALEGIVRARLNEGRDPQDGTTEEVWRMRMARRFVADLQAKPGYAQFRIIGAADGGREIVRVDRSGPGGTVRIVPDDQLQKKGGRDFFVETSKLPKGSVYLSKIGLNREQDQLEIPLQPVIRAATPIHTPSGEFFGIVVINVDLRQTFVRVSRAEHPGGRVYVVNEDGYYLVHPQPEKTFGFEVGREARLQADYPELAGELGKAGAKIGIMRSPAGESLGVAMLPLHPAGGHWLALIETVPEDQLLAPLALVRHSSLMAGGVVALLAAVLALVLARSLTGPLVTLTRTVRSFSIGQALSVKVAAAGEIGVLARAFENMQDEANRKTEALRLSETRYRTLFEYAPDGILIATPQSYYLDANTSLCRMLGYTREEFVGKHASDIVAPSEVQYIGTALTVLNARNDYQREWLFRRKDGSTFPADVIGTMMPDGNLLAVIRDVTERKRTEQAVRDSEEHFHFLNDLGEATRTLTDSSQIMAVMARMLGGHLHASRCAYADVEADGDHFSILHNYTEGCESIVGRYQLSSFGPRAGATLKGGQTLIIRDADKEFAPGEGAEAMRAISIQATISCPLVKDGRLCAMMAVHQTTPRDWQPGEITIVQEVVERCWSTIERRTAEEKIRQMNVELEQRVIERTSQLEAANKELEAFSYSVSHDLRAPLRAVDGFSQAVLEDFGLLLPPEGQRYLQTIRSSAQRMGELIDDLLTFARLSRQELRKQMIDMDQLVRGTLDELGRPWPERKVELRIGALPASAGDAALLKQVWINLLSNALKYTRQREQAIVEIGCLPEHGRNTYFVRDNGTGFDMQYAHKLFGVFQRLHRAEEYEGTGVGLAIVQRVIHRHGGTVWAEAVEDRGATFYFTLGDKNNL